MPIEQNDAVPERSHTEAWDAVDAYFTKTLVPPDSALDEALKANADAGLPSIDVAPNQGKFLHLLALTKSARRILEVGTLGGYSTIWLARALPAGGRLVTLEVSLKHAKVARENLDRAGFAKTVDIRVGPAAESLAQLYSEGAIADAASVDPAVQGTRAMFERMGAEPRLTATAIQTVGGKGYDGFAMAVVLS